MPLQRSWFCVIVIKCFLILPCVSLKYIGVDVGVETYPEGTISVIYGYPLEIFCVTMEYNSDDLEFQLGGKNIESEKINSTTRRLYIENPEKQINVYYCSNKKTKKRVTNRVVVDSPPAEVKNFGCISKNLEEIICSWTELESYALVKYSLTYLIRGRMITLPCTTKRHESDSNSKKIRYCKWDTNSVPRYRQYEETLYLSLSSCSIFGCYSQNFTIDHYSIVKPDPPTNLKVIKNDTHSVVLQWTISNIMVDLIPNEVEHIIEYKITKIDDATHFHRVDSSTLGSGKKIYEFQLSNLPYAHMQYEVRIYVKTKKAINHEYWSDYSHIVFYTAGEIPQRPPEMVTGGFEQRNYGDKRNIYVYWKQLQEYEEGGENFNYKVLVTQDNQSPLAIYSDKTRSSNVIIIREVSMEALNINIWSVNIHGSSINSSYMYIPSNEDIQSVGLPTLSKLAHENGSYELYWLGPKNISNYTLFWCQQDKTQICSSGIDFDILDAHKNRHVIDLPYEYVYQFAIAANYGTKSSGIIWTTCDITKDYKMYEFPVQLYNDLPGNSSVRLRWQVKCPLESNVILGYNISYCSLEMETGSCEESGEYKYKFIEDPIQMDVLIENLLPFQTYQFTLGIKTIYGQKFTTPKRAITTLEDIPNSPVNVGVSDVKSNSLVISWDPPRPRNGYIIQYVIYNYDKIFYVDQISGSDVSRRVVTVTGLKGFTNYSLTVKACGSGIDMCSKPSPNVGIFVRTKIGPPSMLNAPTVKVSPDVVNWEPPTVPGGMVDLYQLKRVREEIVNTTELSYELHRCFTESYQVRAVNIDKDYNYGVIGTGNVTLPKRPNVNTFDLYPGEWSPPTTMITCT